MELEKEFDKYEEEMESFWVCLKNGEIDFEKFIEECFDEVRG